MSFQLSEEYKDTYLQFIKRTGKKSNIEIFYHDSLLLGDMGLDPSGRIDYSFDMYINNGRSLSFIHLHIEPKFFIL